MNYKKIEKIVDKLIPYSIIILLLIIIKDIFFPHYLEEYHIYIKILDYLIITLFVIDLIFKYHSAKNFKIFLKTSWLDILAVFPFYLIIRVVEEAILIFRLSESLETTQKILHETLAISGESGKVLRELEEASKVASEVEKSGKVSRLRLFTRLFRPFQRIPRLIKGIAFYEVPIKKEEKKLVKKIKKLI